MRWASALSRAASTDDAVAETLRAVRRDLDGARADLIVLFSSPHHAVGTLPAQVRAALDGAPLIGCSAWGVIGAGHEVEEAPALSVTAASLPGVTVRAAHLPGDAPVGEAGWLAETLGSTDGDGDGALVLLADPFTCDTDALLGAADAAFPGAHVVGGLASGARLPGHGALYLNDAIHRDGAVAAALSGDITVETLVAQGCRPIGRPMVATRVDGQILYELDGKPPGAQLRALYESLPADDQQRFRQALLIGLELETGGVSFGGDLLARNLAGMDPASGALAVAAELRPWQVVQFLVRDADAARADLVSHLERYRGAGARPVGALLFSCLGRGRHLFGVADHDTALFREHLGAVPIGGFFCNGEIGPVGKSTFLHGYTSAFGLFRPR